ncbi:hypothetical protein QA640_11485 [Bradyrhizobium sp. CB82]|uniref:hypothetical protein n=1 Tax=Bradyrhizobium sp. CB82 TaxID=3039159 RepID=UPI0024B0BE56|nr:hypothetical protein [Bradyrhizobium sp. CB82]WFU43011.1 hypothetical protein QA640_11485 [Bradyrhizobium sp. CB82]
MLVLIRFAAAIGPAKENQIENKLICEGQKLNEQAEPDPADLVPSPGCRQHRGEDTPFEIASYDKPNRGEDRDPGPKAIDRKSRRQQVHRREDAQHRREQLKERQSRGLHGISRSQE